MPTYAISSKLSRKSSILWMLAIIAMAFVQSASAFNLGGFEVPNPFSGGQPKNDPCETEYMRVKLHEDKMIQLVDPNTLARGLDCFFSADDKSKCMGNLAGNMLKNAQKNYLLKKQQQTSNRTQLLASIDQDAGNHAHYLQGLNHDISGLKQCRQSMWRAIQSKPLGSERKKETKGLEKLIAKDQKLITEITGQTAINTNVLVNTSSELGVYQSNKPKKPNSSSGGDKKCVPGASNVRSGPSTSNAKLGTLQAGDCVTILHTVNKGWYQVDYLGQTGYIAQSVFRPRHSSGSTKVASSGGSNVAKAEQGQQQLEDEQESFASLMQEIEENKDIVIGDT